MWRWLRTATTRTDVAAALVAVLVARTAVNGALRVVYPFIPAIARGLGVSLAVVASLVALRALAGLTAPAMALAAEHVGRRALMLAATGTATTGCLVIAASQNIAVVAAGFLLTGLAKPAFDVPMQAWFGDRVPYRRRGRVLGATELTWALSLLATVPLSGVLIDAVGWQAPFVFVAVLAAAGGIAVWRLMEPDRPAHHVRRRLRLTADRVRILGVVLLFSLAAEIVFVVYGAWLEDDLGLSVTAIGLFTLVVAGSELAGEGAVSAFADRVGLRRAIFAGLLGSAVAYGSLGLVGSSLAAAFAVVIAWFIAFEITIVATVPLVSELAVESRERLLSLMVAMVAGARAIGALAAAPIYAWGGMGASGAAAAACIVVAGLLLRRVRPPASPPRLSPPPSRA
jgi:MFS transporter, DHA1 family, inner membrane transport protein